ncbi:UNVERIFIED_CONTAM: hypothetical protein FKN15_071554 [Acipenser sinensis]
MADTKVETSSEIPAKDLKEKKEVVEDKENGKDKPANGKAENEENGEQEAENEVDEEDEDEVEEEDDGAGDDDGDDDEVEGGIGKRAAEDDECACIGYTALFYDSLNQVPFHVLSSKNEPAETLP